MNDRQKILEQLRQQSVQARAQVLSEQVKDRSAISPPIPSAAGASGSGGSGCDPERGIGVYITFDFGEDNPFGSLLKSLGRMEYQGVDEGGKPTYAATLIPETFGVTLNYNYSVSKWEFTFIADDDFVYHSDALIGSNWTAINGSSAISRISTECGYPELPVYCIDTSGISPTGDIGLVQPLPTWIGDQSVAEAPPIWNGVALTFIWLPALGGPDGWFLTAGEEEGGVLGGSINSLPLGEVPLGGSGSVTVSAGACEF